MWHLALALLGLMALTEPALAQGAERPRLSDQGRTLIAGAISGYWAHTDTPYARRSEAEWSIDLSPSFTHFIWQRIGIGAYASYGRQHYRFVEKQVFGLGPNPEWVSTEASASFDRFSIGVQSLSELVLGPRLGLFFWIMAGYAYERLHAPPDQGTFFTSSSAGATAQQRAPAEALGLDQNEHALEATLFVPLTFHVSDRVALGFGPYLQWRGYFGRENDERRVIDFLRVGGSSWIGASF